jgi:hypothetical protein
MVSLREPLRRPSLLIYQLIVAAANYHRRPLLPILLISPINAISPTACMEGGNAPECANSRNGGLDNFASRWNLLPSQTPTRKSILNASSGASDRQYKESLHRAASAQAPISKAMAPISRPSSPVPLKSRHPSMDRLNYLPAMGHSASSIWTSSQDLRRLWVGGRTTAIFPLTENNEKFIFAMQH